MNSVTSQDFSSIVRQFCFEGALLNISPFGNGQIHDTYAVTFATGKGRLQRYILQRMNTHIFTKPVQVMENIEKVTAHLRNAILLAGGDPLRETLTLVPVNSGKYYYIDGSGAFWRAMIFIEGAQSYQTVSDTKLYSQAARAFGRFQYRLADFPTNLLNITIPDFHNTPWRLENFIHAVEIDSVNRLQHVQWEVNFLLQRQAQAGKLVGLEKRGEIPLRVTHNDTKLDNVLIDDHTGIGICVIDLDTVMPGLALYDFGDSVRSAANPAAEDEPDLTKVSFNMPVFECLVQGYLQEVGGLLTRAELENLAFSAWLITYEQAMRFLGDYLNGDTYYKVHRPNHNLDRSHTQIKLIQGMEAHFDEMERKVKFDNN